MVPTSVSYPHYRVPVPALRAEGRAGVWGGLPHGQREEEASS
ncbi:hypothetical protein SAMN02746041_00113 [Desulfacinum hydrothermale DSM 13146]|uniref:Uncharacterized protein n=1 Tax=Desulfacinum hydrothermale DSM 13146 TaxID=1121390 RepID=A0A1W1WYE3_9BACT|nr:hypothetical protein SAMN02746041_00113 [Desulfacinum hydrothermale DSM 13146]